MFEFSKSDYESLTPLYLSGESEFPLIRAVIESAQDGRIFVDRETDSESCIVFTKFGFTYLFGNQNNKKFNAEIANLIFNDSNLKLNYLLWYKPPICWITKFNKFSQETFRLRERIRYKFDVSQFNQSKGPSVASKYKLKRIDNTLVNQISHFSIDFPTRFWRSPNDFLESGFGFCMLYKNTVVGICYTACITSSLAEIDVATIEEHRGNKIGSILTHTFISYCIKNNIEPTWDCFTYNEPSKRIAEAMGFVKKERYSFYSFNRPIDQSEILEEFMRWH